jgi:hypothetical protein
MVRLPAGVIGIGIETVSPHSAAPSLARRASASLPSWRVNAGAPRYLRVAFTSKFTFH